MECYWHSDTDIHHQRLVDSDTHSTSFGHVFEWWVVDVYCICTEHPVFPEVNLYNCICTKSMKSNKVRPSVPFTHKYIETGMNEETVDGSLEH
jgi:hypothetical protein